MIDYEVPRITANELRFIADSVPALISYIDSNARYCFVNAEYRRWFDRLPEEIVGKSVEEVIGTDAWKARLPYFEGVLRGIRQDFTGKVLHRDGTVRDVRLSYVPDMLGGETRGFVVLAVECGKHFA